MHILGVEAGYPGGYNHAELGNVESLLSAVRVFVAAQKPALVLQLDGAASRIGKIHARAI